MDDTIVTVEPTDEITTRADVVNTIAEVLTPHELDSVVTGVVDNTEINTMFSLMQSDILALVREEIAKTVNIEDIARATLEQLKNNNIDENDIVNQIVTQEVVQDQIKNSLLQQATVTPETEIDEADTFTKLKNRLIGGQ